MAEPTAEERRAELAEAFADGLDIFESRSAERKAKAEATNKDNDGKGGNGDNDPPKSWRDRLLG